MLQLPRRSALALLLLAAACGKSGGGSSKSTGRDVGSPITVVAGRGGAKPGVSASLEKEPNDQAGNAQPIGPPPAVRGMIDTAGDRDVYELKVTAIGTLVARLS